MVPLLIGQKISGHVEKLVYGGFGLVRHQGIVIFVPDVIPGEQVYIEVTRTKARYAEGRLLSLGLSSLDRKEPLCPFYGQCGGCQLQHIDPAVHSSIKKTWLCEALHSLGPEKMDYRFVPTEEVFGWRRKITLHGRLIERHWVFGFVGRDGRQLIPISWCPLFFADSERALLEPLISKVSASLPASHHTLDLTLFRLPDKNLSVTLSGSLFLSKDRQKLIIDRLIALPYVKAISFRLPHQQYDIGDSTFCFNALGRSWYGSSDAFMQNHSRLMEVLWKEALEMIDVSGRRQRILDLYAGIGCTAISLADRGHTVTAVELSEAAVRMAQKSEKDLSCRKNSTDSNRPAFCQSSVEAFLPSVKGAVDWIIVNPPRTGLSKPALFAVLSIRPKRILYISCCPSTLARDLSLMRTEGWQMVKATGYDMFPQTTHFETMALVERKR